MLARASLVTVLLGGISLLASCSPATFGSGRWTSYQEAAGSFDRRVNPIIVIPGILGSKLVDHDTNKVAWGSYGLGAIRHASGEGRRTLALPMEPGAPLDRLRDQVTESGTLDRVTFGPGFGVNAYARLLQTLAIGGYREQQLSVPGGDEHFSCFQFGYDWRRSNAENAARLADFIGEKKRWVESEMLRRYGIRREVKFDIVAHSMGGLLARYYLMYGRAPLPAGGGLPELTWAGARNVERLIQVGSPNAGSAQALLQMTGGLRLAPFVAKFQPAVIGTFPAAYELLPDPDDHTLTDHDGSPLNVFDPQLWRSRGWGLADPRQDAVIKELLPEIEDADLRARIALDHQRKCLASARRFRQALNCPCALPRGVEMHAFVGEGHQTVHRLSINPEGYPAAAGDLPGDGTVTVRSATLEAADGTHGPIPWTSIRRLHSSHIRLTSDPEFIDQLLHLLLTNPSFHSTTQ